MSNFPDILIILMSHVKKASSPKNQEMIKLRFKFES